MHFLRYRFRYYNKTQNNSGLKKIIYIHIAIQTKLLGQLHGIRNTGLKLSWFSAVLSNCSHQRSLCVMSLSQTAGGEKRFRKRNASSLQDSEVAHIACAHIHWFDDMTTPSVKRGWKIQSFDRWSCVPAKYSTTWKKKGNWIWIWGTTSRFCHNVCQKS